MGISELDYILRQRQMKGIFRIREVREDLGYAFLDHDLRILMKESSLWTVCWILT